MRSLWVLDTEAGAQQQYKECFSDYKLEFFDRPSAVQSELKSRVPFLLISELYVGNESFLDLLADQKAKFQNCNVVIVSSHNQMDLFRYSFQLGVKDFWVKPIDSNELRFKVDRICNTTSEDLFFNDATHTVQNKFATSIQFTPKEYNIFKLIYYSGDRVVEKQAIQKVCWPSISTTANTLDVHLYNVRRKIEILDLAIVHLPPKKYQLVTLKR